jgi:hypothetical protein
MVLNRYPPVELHANITGRSNHQPQINLIDIDRIPGFETSWNIWFLNSKIEFKLEFNMASNII